MAQLRSTSFDCYDFTEQEMHDASTLNPLQKMYITTEASIKAAELLALPPNPENPVRFMLDREYIRGGLEMLQWLLQVSEDTKTQLERRFAEDEALAAATLQTSTEGN